MIKEISTKEEFNDEVTQFTGTVIIDFFAEWCGPCKRFLPTLETFSTTTSAKVIKINVDEAKELASMHGVKSIPVLFVYKNGVLSEGPLKQQTPTQLKELADS